MNKIILLSLLILSTTLILQNKGVHNSVKLGNINDSGLIGWWTFDTTRYGTGASQVLDSSGNGRHGTVTGTPIAKATTIQQGLEFDGDSVTAINLSSGIALTDFTVCAWFVPLSGRTGYDRIVDMGFQQGFWIGNDTGTNNWGGGIRNDDGNALFTGTTLTDNQWHHLCLKRSGTVQNTVADGKTITTATVTSTATGSGINIRAATSNFGSTDGCKCIIDDVRLYNRALSNNEIAQLYQDN